LIKRQLTKNVAMGMLVSVGVFAGCAPKVEVADQQSALCAHGDKPTSGAVSVSQDADGSVVLASFYKTLTNNLDCVTQTAGSCSLELCTGTAGARTQKNFSAGTIHVTGDTSFDLLPTPPNGYPISSVGGAFWNAATGHDPVTVTADGDEVPGFSVHLHGPKAVTMVTPPAGTEDLSLDPSGDITFEWTGGTGDIEATVQGFNNTGNGFATVKCDVPAAAGTVVVPAQMLSQVALWSASALLSQSTHKVIQRNGVPMTVELKLTPVSAFVDAPFP